MNVLHMKYAVEVAEAGSINKASEKLEIAQPNLSRSIKELESDLGISIFERTTKGMSLTPYGEEFIGHAKEILAQIDEVEKMYRGHHQGKQVFSIAVPRACYCSSAFAQFSKNIDERPTELYYKETNSSRVIDYVANNNFNLGIVRYSENYDNFFKIQFEEKNLDYELVTNFNCKIVMNKECDLAKLKEIRFTDLKKYIEIAHGDPYVPNLTLAQARKQELPNDIQHRILVFERGSQFDLLSENKDTFMWVSPIPQTTLERYGLVQRECPDNKKTYCDVLIKRKNYKLSELDNLYIKEVIKAKDRM